MQRLFFRALGIAGFGLGLSWVLLAGRSPLSSFVTDQPLITNVASAINLPTVVFAFGDFPGTAGPSDFAVLAVAIAQWLSYGMVAAWVWGRLRPNEPPKLT